MCPKLRYKIYSLVQEFCCIICSSLYTLSVPKISEKEEYVTIKYLRQSLEKGSVFLNLVNEILETLNLEQNSRKFRRNIPVYVTVLGVFAESEN